MIGGILAGARKISVGEGRTLRILSALEILQARREAEGLAQGAQERALCSNACLLAKALEKHGVPLFERGEGVLCALSVGEIECLARQWGELNRRENPSPQDAPEEVETLKKGWSTRPMSAFAGVCSAVLVLFQRRFVPRR